MARKRDADELKDREISDVRGRGGFGRPFYFRVPALSALRAQAPDAKRKAPPIWEDGGARDRAPDSTSRGMAARAIALIPASMIRGRPAMGASASFSFFPSDWLGDPNLGQCSFGAQGLWMGLICLAAESVEYGYVMIAGKVADPPMIAKALRSAPEIVEPLLAELLKWNVCERDSRGCIFSRRLVRKASNRPSNSPSNPPSRPSSKALAGRLGGLAKARNKKEKEVLLAPKPSKNLATPTHPIPSPDLFGSVEPTRAPRAARPKGPKPPKPPKEKKPPYLSPIPGDWTPSEDQRNVARSIGWDEEAIDRMAISFRLHYAGTGRKMHSWSAVWEKWCRREAEDDGSRKPRGSNRTSARDLADRNRANLASMARVFGGKRGDDEVG